LNEEQHNEICTILQKRKDTIDRYINTNVKSKVIKSNMKITITQPEKL